MRSYKLKSTVLYVLVGFLIFSNLFLYNRYTIIKGNINYIENIANKINLAKTTNNIDPITTLIIDQEKDFLIPLLEEIATKGGTAYRLENYIALKYKNGNTLLVQTTQNEEGIFFIQDMFFLDEQSYDKLILSAINNLDK